MSSFLRLKIKTKYKMNKVSSNIYPIVVNNFKEKVKPKTTPKSKPKIDYIERYRAYLGYILN